MDSYVCHAIDEVDENILSYPKYRDKHSIQGSKGLFTKRQEELSPREPPHPFASVYHPKLAYSSCSIFDTARRVGAIKHNSEEIFYKRDQGVDGNITVRNFEKSNDVFQRLVDDAEARKLKGNWINQLKNADCARGLKKKCLPHTDSLWKNIENSLLKKKNKPRQKPRVKVEVGYDKDIIDSMLFKSKTPNLYDRRSPIRLRHLKSSEIADYRETNLFSRLSTQDSQK